MTDKRKGGRPKTGTVVKTRDGRFWQGVITLADGTRKRLEPFPLGTSKARAKESVAAYMERVAATSDGVAASTAQREAMADWVKTWDEDRVARGRTSTRDNLGHYNQHIGASTNWLHVRNWTKDTLRKLSHDLDVKVQGAELSWKTAVNIWSTATKMCDDAAESKLDTIKCRDDNPAIGVRGPDRGDEVSKQFLYPNELTRFLAHEDVPLRWRIIVAVAVYTYLRDGELRVLLCGDVDTEHGSLSVTKAWDRRGKKVGSPKGGRSRDVAIEPALAGLLQALKADRPDHERLFPKWPSDRDMSRGLQTWLKRGGVTRAVLFNRTPTSRPIRFHDLRGTGITWRAVRNDPKFELQYHAGHRRFSTTEEYLHLADAIRRGFGDVFPPVPAELVERASSVGFDHGSDRAPDPQKQNAENLATLGDFTSGADGTRTRGLRRDRPAL